MKSDFKKYRRLGWLARAFVLLAAVAHVCCRGCACQTNAKKGKQKGK